MKRPLCLLLGLGLLVCLCACTDPFSNDNNDTFESSLLYGKWQEGTVYEHYYASPVDYVLSTGDIVKVNGITWDTSDDVGEDEGQAFNWTLDGATLTHEHISTFATVPKIYTITTLTSDRLTYVDDYGTSHYYTKVD